MNINSSEITQISSVNIGSNINSSIIFIETNHTENRDVSGQIDRKLDVGFSPNVVCKTSKILRNNFNM